MIFRGPVTSKRKLLERLRHPMTTCDMTSPRTKSAEDLFGRRRPGSASYDHSLSFVIAGHCCISWDSGRIESVKQNNYNNEINKRTDGFASHPSFYFWALPADSGEAFCFRPSIRCRDWQSETFWSDDSAADRRPDWLELAGCGAFQAHYINIHRRCVLAEFRYRSSINCQPITSNNYIRMCHWI